MSRGIRKTGIFIAIMLTVVVLTGCQTRKEGRKWTGEGRHYMELMQL